MSEDIRHATAAKFPGPTESQAPEAASGDTEPRPAEAASFADPDLPPVPLTTWSLPEDSEALARGLKARSNPAEWVFQRLVLMIEEFEAKLSHEEEVGAHLVNAPGEGAIEVHDLGFWGPDLILFYGKNQYGRQVRLIQHYAQLNVLLTALPKESREPPRRIGFQLRARVEKAAAKDKPAPMTPVEGAPKS